MYAQFLEEVFGISYHENNYGFCTYCFYSYGNERVLAIKDVFIKPEFRGLKRSLDIVDETITIAKENNCNTCTVVISKNAKENVQERTTKLCQIKGFEKYDEDFMHDYFKKVI